MPNSIIEQPNGDDGHSQVTAFFEVIPGQNAQPTGIDGQRGVQAILGRQVDEGDDSTRPYSAENHPA